MSPKESFGRPTESKLSKLEQVSLGAASVASKDHEGSNEDSMLLNPSKGYFGVFDGVSGSIDGSGQIASERFTEYLVGSLDSFPQGISAEQAKEYLNSQILGANEKLINLAKAENLENSIHTTCSIVKVIETPDKKKKLIVGNVGDSRFYLVRGGKLNQITVDDNGYPLELQEELNRCTDSSKLSQLGKVYFDNRNKIIQAIGMPNIKPNIYIVDIEPGDCGVVASDGFHDNLSSQEAEQYFDGSLTEQQICNNIIEASKSAADHKRQGNFRGKQDDMSVIVFKLG